MGYKMLIIEDEVMIRKGLVCLTDWKAQGITEIRDASNGAEGVALIKEFCPDIVITDICMPMMSGLEVIEQTMATYKYIPIIISGYSDFEYAQKAIEFGVTAKGHEENKLVIYTASSDEQIDAIVPLY